MSGSEALDYSKYFWQGSRVRLRPLRPGDAEQAFADSLDTPSRTTLELGVELPTSVPALREFMGRYGDCKDVDGVIIFCIETLDGTSVGGISWHTRSPKNGTFSFGVNVRTDQRRHRYAEEAARILFRYAFSERRFQKCTSACLSHNEASIRLHHKLGFVEEGRRRRQFYVNGRYHDETLFGLTREEFEANDQRSG